MTQDEARPVDEEPREPEDEVEPEDDRVSSPDDGFPSFDEEDSELVEAGLDGPDDYSETEADLDGGH